MRAGGPGCNAVSGTDAGEQQHRTCYCRTRRPAKPTPRVESHSPEAAVAAIVVNVLVPASVACGQRQLSRRATRATRTKIELPRFPGIFCQIYPNYESSVVMVKPLQPAARLIFEDSNIFTRPNFALKACSLKLRADCTYASFATARDRNQYGSRDLGHAVRCRSEDTHTTRLGTPVAGLGPTTRPKQGAGTRAYRAERRACCGLCHCHHESRTTQAAQAARKRA